MDGTVFRGWRLAYDAPATAKAYAATRPIGPESCGCSYCRNFIQARSQIYPNDLRLLAGIVGIMPLTETEVWEYCAVSEERPTLRLYGGFFHFVGNVVANPDVQSEEVRFSARRDLLPESFGSSPVVQVEFTLEVPWLLTDEPPPS
jgi:hypothetical protein